MGVVVRTFKRSDLERPWREGERGVDRASRQVKWWIWEGKTGEELRGNGVRPT